jgi:hypothetical protein
MMLLQEAALITSGITKILKLCKKDELSRVKVGEDFTWGIS